MPENKIAACLDICNPIEIQKIYHILVVEAQMRTSSHYIITLHVRPDTSCFYALPLTHPELIHIPEI